MRFVVLKTVDGLWHWELRETDGVVVAKSSVQYPDRAAVVSALLKVQSTAPKSLVFDLLGNLV
ncbi:DUF1508 domain-containing protein [Variovorax sp. PAMC 28711]|uniref:YegP family protein n=1 Tax=Variovorax sp. PAMC 28711 TaxID=1795631 RepID=UPI0009E7EBB6